MSKVIMCNYGGKTMPVEEYKQRKGVKQFEKSLKNLAKGCASFSAGKLCTKTGRTCNVFNDQYFPTQQKRRCSYFERFLLPADEQSMSDYYSVMQGGKVLTKDVITCSECKQPFERNSNSQKYCFECRPLIKRRHDANYRSRKVMK